MSTAKLQRLEAMIDELEQQLSPQTDLMVIHQRDDGTWDDVDTSAAKVIIMSLNFKWPGWREVHGCIRYELPFCDQRRVNAREETKKGFELLAAKAESPEAYAAKRQEVADWYERFRTLPIMRHTYQNREAPMPRALAGQMAL